MLRDQTDTLLRARRDAWTRDHFADTSDMALSSYAMNLDARIIEHNMFCCCDEDDPCMGVERRYLAAATWEMERREAAGEVHIDPTEPTLEERLAPFGIEWELE